VASLPETLGALARSPYAARRGRSVKDEVRANLLARLAAGGPLFEGVLGYEDTVMPQIVNALLSRHNFILLGPARPGEEPHPARPHRAARPEMPIVAGQRGERRPFAPISKYARQRLAEGGDDTPDRLGGAREAATSRSSPRPT
jgi:magnesium chelatase subunit I